MPGGSAEDLRPRGPLHLEGAAVHILPDRHPTQGTLHRGYAWRAAHGELGKRKPCLLRFSSHVPVGTIQRSYSSIHAPIVMLVVTPQDSPRSRCVMYCKGRARYLEGLSYVEPCLLTDSTGLFCFVLFFATTSCSWKYTKGTSTAILTGCHVVWRSEGPGSLVLRGASRVCRA